MRVLLIALALGSAAANALPDVRRGDAKDGAHPRPHDENVLKITSEAEAFDTKASAEVVADELYKNKNVVGASTGESMPEKTEVEGSKGYEEQRVALAAPMTAERRRLAAFVNLTPRKLVSSATANEDQFGYSMALSGDLLAVKSRTVIDIFDLSLSPSSWLPQALSISDLQDDWAVALDGKLLAVGASGPVPASSDDKPVGIGSDKGVVHIYDLSGPQASWAGTKLTLDAGTDSAPGDLFGYSVALDARRLVVGAWGTAFETLTYAGAAYVFDLSGTDKTKWAGTRQKLETTSTYKPGTEPYYEGLYPYAKFGQTVAINGNFVVVGAPGTISMTVDRPNRRGHVWIYELQNGQWAYVNNWARIGVWWRGIWDWDYYGSAIALSKDGHLAVGDWRVGGRVEIIKIHGAFD
jgi:hypothetical protein